MNDTASILVLEDDDEMRDMLSEVLRDHGYTVVAVSRGDEAVVQVSQQPFDLIVADIRMDGMDGLEVLERTRQQQPSIGTLVVSGYATEAETTRANRISVGGYLKKPFRMGQFLELVREQLRGKHDVERSRQQNTSRRVGTVVGPRGDGQDGRRRRPGVAQRHHRSHGNAGRRPGSSRAAVRAGLSRNPCRHHDRRSRDRAPGPSSPHPAR